MSALLALSRLQSEDSEQPLRFRVSLGSSGAAQAAAAPVIKLKPKGSERTERLQQKYGLPPEAARRLVPIDRDFAPSGVLLRDICCALLRVAAGRVTAGAAAAVGEQPRAAKLQSEENEVRVCVRVGWELLWRTWSTTHIQPARPKCPLWVRLLPALHPGRRCPATPSVDASTAWVVDAPLVCRTRFPGPSASATRCGCPPKPTWTTAQWPSSSATATGRTWLPRSACG